MSTAHEICSNCGAKLPAGDLGSVLVCEYCGTENRIEWKPPAPAPAPEPPPRYVPSPRYDATPDEPVPKGSGGGCVVITGLLATVFVIVVVVAVRGKACGAGALTPSQLHTASLAWNVDSPLDAPPPTTSLARFDALANIEWAGTIGRAWWPDATLKHIVVDPVGKDGFIDLTKKGVKVEYDFYSPQCRADYLKRMETTPGLHENTCHFVLALNNDSTTVTLALIGPGDDLETIDHPPCTIAQVFTRLAADGKLPARPTYSITVYGHPGEVRWKVSQGTGSSPFQSEADLPYAFCKGK